MALQLKLLMLLLRQMTNKRTMKNIIYYMIGMLTLASCSQQIYTISGTSSQVLFDGKMAYLKSDTGDGVKSIDSCEVVHGKFSMNGDLDSVVCVNFFMGDDNFIPVILEPGAIKINIANASVSIGGTRLNDRLYSFLNSRDSLTMLLNELPNKESNMYLDGYNESYIYEQICRENAELRMAVDKLETNFIINNFDNVLGVTWFMRLCNSAFHEFGYATTTPQIDEIYARSPKAFKNNPDVKAYMNLVYNPK